MVQEIDRIYAVCYLGLTIGFPLVFVLYHRALFYARVLQTGTMSEYKAALAERAEEDPVAKLSLRFLKGANLYFAFYWVSFAIIVGSHYSRGWWTFWH